MPSNRRLRIFFAVVLTTALFILYRTSTSRSSPQAQDFYSRTRSRLSPEGYPISSSLDKIVPSRQDSGNGEEDAVAQSMSNRLRQAEMAAKERANAKAPTRESVMGEQQIVDDKGTAAQPGTKNKPTVEDLSAEAKPKDRNVAGRKKFPTEEDQKMVQESEEEKDVTAEINSLLKMSPIIIFSKSYCPHSKRAKTILLEKYNIVPAPYVVELDEHAMGPALQARLATMTGRSTVPNVLVKGKSIGGGSEVAELDSSGTLIDTVKSMGGKQMISVGLKEVNKSQ